jgi:all-trans-retinol 13,14-reductase
MNKSDVLIVGSGISALTCGLLLAKRGKSVTLLEQYSKPGGYLHCFNRFGERYDTGAHYIGAMDPGHPFHTLLNYLGVYNEDSFIPLDPEGFDEFHFPEFSFSLPKGYEQAIQAMAEVFPNERAAITKFFELTRQAVKYFPTYEFDDAFLEAPAKEIFETSLADVVQKLTSNTKLQAALYVYCPLHGVQPGEVAFGFHSLVVDSLIRGAYGLRHGGDQVTKDFTDELERLGGKVLTKKKVVNFEIQDRQIKRVLAHDGEAYEADWIVSSIHPKATMALCEGTNNFPPAFVNRVQSLKESVGLLGISALTTEELSPLKNYYYFDTSNPEQFLRHSSNVEAPSAVFISAAHREHAPSKGDAQPINIHSAAPIEWFSDWRDSRYAKRPPAYKQFKDQLAENVFAQIEKYRPGFRASIQNFSVSTPLTNLHFNGSADGSAYGLYHSIQNTGPRAIGPRTKVLNLLLTGQNCLFPGLLGAAIAGLRTSGHIVGIKPMLGELKKLGALR